MKYSEGQCSALELLEQWLDAKEGENFEFKEAKENYHFDKLAKYCCALSNEGGGKIILGVSDRRPRKVVGTSAFEQPEQTRRALSEKLHLLIDFIEFKHPNGRVLVFEAPSRPIGNVVKYEGIYWARETDSLVPMSERRLQTIFSESGHDFSADICPGATIEALEKAAIEEFRKRWIDKSKNTALATISPEQLLRDAELLTSDSITFAALILFGTKASIGRFLGQSEIIFEYRSTEASGPAQQRKEYRQGFFSYYDELWSVINLRNDIQHYQDGLFIKDIPTFAERSVREAILNAVSHRNYQLGGSVFIRQFPQHIVIESPGGLPYGITLENILERQNPRNRRLADAFAKCGLVERSGQGVNLMFEQCVQQGKIPPDFQKTDEYAVVLELNGQVRDPKFVQYLERIGQETQASFSTHDFIVLDHIHREEPIPEALQCRLKNLLEFGAIERTGRNRYVLAKRFYSIIGKKGVYTRKKGLDRETNKQLILKHIRDNAKEGTKVEELYQILPGHSRGQMQALLRELRESALIQCIGVKKGARWFPQDLK
jgi:ATP-dependent DNA helicase RecG